MDYGQGLQEEQMTEYKPDAEEAIERFLQQWTAAMEVVRQSVQSFTKILLPAFEAFDEALRTMYAGFWEDYLAAGAPYDRTAEGFARWLDELTGKAEVLATIEEAQEHEEHQRWSKLIVERFRKTEDLNGAARDL